MKQTITRRDFARLLAFGAGIPLLPAATARAAPRRAGARILVIGAGISGIAAARHLVDQGLEVTVLEGRARIGGRISTDRSWPDQPLEMGAGWIQTSVGNPITELARKFEMKASRSNYDSYTLYDTDGRRLADARVDAIETRFDELMAAVNRARRQRRRANLPDISLGAAIDGILDGQKLSAIQRREIIYSVNTTIEHEYAADVSDMSLYSWDGDSGFSGPDLFVTNGYDRIVNGLATGLDIRLEHVVRRIEHSAAGVKVTTNKGNFAADAVLVTIPLGVLKRGDVEFSPALPASKQRAISRLGMGVLNRLFLRFRTPFWAAAGTELIGYIPARKGEWSEGYSLHHFTGQPVLLLFNAGAFGLAVEQLDDKATVASAMEVLRRIYGSSVPDPLGYRLTRWAADPFTRGSYSHAGPGATMEDYDRLAEPVGNSLFFAGEATSSDYPATVHGAYLSGLREAERIAGHR